MCLTTMNKESMFVQAEREKLQGDVSKLSQEKGLVELRLRSYETEKTRLAPTLEETQWEVSPRRGFCYRHFRVVGLANVSLSGGRGHPRVSTPVHEHVYGPL